MPDAESEVDEPPLFLNRPLRLQQRLAAWFVGDGVNRVHDFVALINKDFRPSRPSFPPEVERAIRAHIEFEGWLMPTFLSLSPLNSLRAFCILGY